MKKKILGPLLILLGFVLAGCSNTQDTKSTKVKIGTPTLFFHGGGSSYHAEEHMVSAAKKAGVTKSVIRAEVAASGKVSLLGSFPKNAKNPIVEVNYENNREMNFTRHGIYATNVVKALQKKYNFKQMNMVGHSLGNISIIYYMLQNSQNKKLPKLVKQVDMAGHFAGLNFSGVPASIRQPKGLKIAQNGKPNKMNASYRQMTKLRKIYPKNQVRVLNIIGDIGGKTDGTVPNVSSLSLKYLVSSRAKSYRVVKFTGKNARHSKLHENTKVDKVLIKFLWNK